MLAPVAGSIAVAQEPSQQTNLLVLGDSLSAAYGLREEQGWVALLANDWRSSKPSVNVINVSVSGATTAAGLNLLADLLRQHQPKWMILELGGNDGLQGKPLTYIRQNLQQLIDMAQQHRTAVYLIGMRLPPNLGKRYTEPFFQQYSELAQANHLPLSPFLLDGIAGVPELMQSDGIHPNAMGQEQIFRNMKAPLETWLSSFGGQSTPQ